MTDSTLHPREEDQKEVLQKHLCDHCSDSVAILYCRADSAKLCFFCDREVHSANQLFTKHTRSRLCDSCNASPASIFCSTENSVLCQNCDWERHSLSLLSVHNRRPIEGFTGCPSVSEFLGILGFENMGHKALFSEQSGVVGGDGFDGVEDLMIWDPPGVVNLDKLIGSTNSDHNFQAMGVPSLPKNRNVACGKHKEEILGQLRELAKLEPNLNYENVDAEPFVGFQSLVPEQNVQPGNMYNCFAHDAEPPVFPGYQASEFQWRIDGGEAANQHFLPNLSNRSYLEESCAVPDILSDISGSASHVNNGNERQLLYPIKSETSSALPEVASHELKTQNRDSAISRYKQKKKTRRYDKHVRYESRKVRAESRTRIKGRFAK